MLDADELILTNNFELNVLVLDGLVHIGQSSNYYHLPVYLLVPYLLTTSVLVTLDYLEDKTIQKDPYLNISTLRNHYKPPVGKLKVA